MAQARSLEHWLFLRLAVATLVFTAGVLLLTISADGVPRAALYGVLASHFAAVFGGYVAARRNLPIRRVRLAEMATDVGLITVAVHLTGGTGSTFSLLYFFPILLAAFQLQRRGAILTACLAAAAILTQTVLSATGVIEPPLILPKAAPPGQMVFLEAHFAVALVLIVGFLAGELAGRIEGGTRKLVRKQSELERAWLETQGIVDNMSSGVLSVNRDGRIERLNPSAERILGLSLEEIGGSLIRESLASVMPALATHLDEAVRRGTSHERIEFNIMRQDTRLVPIGVSISQQFDSDGAPRGVIAVFQDLTEVLRMRERMRASDRLAAMGELSAEIAHEIRNPLASIRGSVEMLATELRVDGENAHLMDLILRESERLNRIIEDFLEYARLRPQQTRRVPLRDVLDDVERLVRMHDDLQVELKVSYLQQHDFVVDIDEEQMKQVFLNLVLNAAEAMTGKGRLSILVEEARDGENHEVVVRVIDEGPGIDESDLGNLFKPFFTTKPEGTGLGLPLANRVVANHGGRIAASNRLEGGAEFAVHLNLIGIWRDTVLLSDEVERSEQRT